MKKIHCLNPIAKCGTELFPAGYEMTDKAADADAVLVRSASMHDMELPENLLQWAVREQVSTIFLWTPAPRRASLYSIHREPMPTA